MADDSKVKYVEDGAIITGLGFITLNNPDPMTFELENQKQCTGDLELCYKALTPSAGSSPPCELGFQKFVIYDLERTSGFRDTEIGSNMRFTLAKESRFGIPPDVSDGSYHYQVLELPKNCNFKVVGATDPKPPVTTDPLKTAKLVIYMLAGSAGVILILAIACVIYCICCNRKRDASKPSAVPR
uniref:Uncharacterized protein n=1 Tax=Panagrellus redivivus TaxID=6233 RepID=A0A7E4VF63_PANRE